MRKYTLSLAALRVIQISQLLLSVLITALSLIYLSSLKILMICIIAICWVITLLSAGLLLPLGFRKAVINISTAEISFHYGILFRHRQHMRAESVQYVSQMKMPLSSVTGFNFVAIHALGATIILPFLKRKDSEEIITLLQERIIAE